MSLTITEVLNGAADLLEREGWSPASGNGRDILTAIARINTDPEVQENAWDAIVTHLGERLVVPWQREPGRTQEQVLAMLREVAQKADAQ